ncbi:hypothetical protein PK35_14660 [Tamlana nanhaiensis]|uniref:Uncharacterized protein n=1 Tax=Neotamlana nanhaiensis TaxID=1382798 RepID=A0A0D7VYE3_9FLAO|nr:hypothetical protein PK35_14660 [Tamlana nanhaiensis]
MTKHITFKFFALLLVGLLCLPTILKLQHSFEHHEHKVCLDDSTTHIHTVDLDCDFHKFQLNHHFTLTEQTFESLPETTPFQNNFKSYSFLKNHQHLYFSLRAPPAFI